MTTIDLVSKILAAQKRTIYLGREIEELKTELAQKTIELHTLIDSAPPALRASLAEILAPALYRKCKSVGFLSVWQILAYSNYRNHSTFKPHGIGQAAWDMIVRDVKAFVEKREGISDEPSN